MPRRPRQDTPGSWHHVMNRGIARRTIFEREDDIRGFLAVLACHVRAGDLELHADAVLTTHYHLLVRSLEGRLGEVMRAAQTAHSRSFNRSRRRDGPLVRGRYRSVPVGSDRYRRALVGYIDANPVQAGLVDDPTRYRHGSARAYATRSGPPWLSRGWVEEEVRAAAGSVTYEPADYPRIVRSWMSQPLRALVERRLERPWGRDPVDDLLRAAPPQVLEWMRRKVRVADGAGATLPVVEPSGLKIAVEQVQIELGIPVPRSCRVEAGWHVALAGLAVELGDVPGKEVASWLDCSEMRVTRLVRMHREWLLRQPAYAARAQEIACRALAVWR